jgi:predicted DNA-binding transcriptional regulator AlpA
MNAYDLPNTGFLRIRDVQRFIPVSRSHLWNGIKMGI